METIKSIGAGLFELTAFGETIYIEKTEEVISLVRQIHEFCKVGLADAVRVAQWAHVMMNN